MTAWEYHIKDAEKCISYDEAQNMYVDVTLGASESVMDLARCCCIWLGYGMYLVDEEIRKKLSQYTIIDCETESISWVRRPYYRLRGKTVTEEQAFDIIRGTASLLGDIDEIWESGEYVGGYNFKNFIFDQNVFPGPQGWIHTSGEVGMNSITAEKYPSKHSFILEWLENIMRFPYLDVVIAVTCWDEVSPAVYDYDWRDSFRRENIWEHPQYDIEFCEDIAFGLHVYDKTVEVLNKEEAARLYREYSSKYAKNWEKYMSDYYAKHKDKQADLSYLKRCIESYGLDAEAALSKIPEYIWKKRD